MTSTRMLGGTANGLVWRLGFAGIAIGATACAPRHHRAAGQPADGETARKAAPSGDTVAQRPRALTYLQDDFERIFPERVRLARYGEVRFAAHDVGDAGGEGARSDVIEMAEAPTLVVVDKVDDHIRVIAPQDHYRLLLWLDVNDLYTVLTEPAVLAHDRPGGATTAQVPGGAGIRLHPGIPLEVDGERTSMAHIRHRDRCVSFSGWVPRTAIGTQFVPIEASTEEGNAHVGAGTAILDHPGGRQVARFLADCDVTQTGPEVDGYQPIRYLTEWFELRGWVATGASKPGSGNSSNGGAWGYGLGHLGLLGSPRRFRLAEATCLYARRGGPSVGVITEDAEAPVSTPVKGWWQVPLETAWGDLTVWVGEDRVQAMERASERSPRVAARTSRADGGGESGIESDETPTLALRTCR